MIATIKITRAESGKEVDHEATFDGDQWESEDEFTAHFLNAYTSHWQLKGYHPDPVIGTAMDIAESLHDTLKAEFVGSDEIDYADVPEEAEL